MTNRVIVAGLLTKDDKYLFGHRDNNIGPYPNTWQLIGGGVDLATENLEEALRREVREETGLEITNIKRLSFDEDYEPNKKGERTHYVFLVFEANVADGQIKPGDDIKRLSWFSKEDFSDIPLARPTVKLFKALGLL